MHFDNHLYTPLVVWRGKEKEEIRSVPVRLNKGETKFVVDFKKFLNGNKEFFKNKDIFLLRNLSRRGVGFFTSSGFYPDFIIWIKNKNRQNMIFVDPKGIRNLGHFNDDKILLCVPDFTSIPDFKAASTYINIKEIEKGVNERLKKRREDVALTLDAFIISTSRYDDIKKTWENGRFSNIDYKDAEEEFDKYNILFQEDDTYIQKIFEKAGVVKND